MLAPYSKPDTVQAIRTRYAGREKSRVAQIGKNIIHQYQVKIRDGVVFQPWKRAGIFAQAADVAPVMSSRICIVIVKRRCIERHEVLARRCQFFRGELSAFGL